MLRPILLILFSSLCFSLMDAISKLLVADNDPFMIVWARFAIGLPAIAYLAWRHPRRLLASDRPAMQVFRALLPFVLSVAVIYSLRFLPLAEMTAILFTMPLMLIPLAALLLRERITGRQLAAVAAGFVGALIIIRPGAGALQWAALLALGAAAGAALMQVITRWLHRGSDPLATFAYTMLVGFLVACLPLPWVWHSMSAGAWALLAVGGIAQLLAHGTLIAAFSRAPSVILAPYLYSQLIGAALFGILLFGEWPDLPTIAGAAVIVVAGLYAAAAERRTAGTPAAS
ncbi:MAG TPA: DMT family transporter [Dongiaceae bacterium]|jgi:drug/metabolite transporter (DMT)-like permease